ncbi:unnamed protein product [Arctogadus glacialis]
MPSPPCPSSIIDQSQTPSSHPNDNPLPLDSDEEEEEEEEVDELDYAARLYLHVTHDQPSNHHGSMLPPVPPPHRQQPSVTALNHSLST